MSLPDATRDSSFNSNSDLSVHCLVLSSDGEEMNMTRNDYNCRRQCNLSPNWIFLTTLLLATFANAFVIYPDGSHARSIGRIITTGSHHDDFTTRTVRRTMFVRLMAKKFTINENLVGSINSDGIFEGKEKVEQRPQSKKLGVPNKSYNKIQQNSSSRGSHNNEQQQQQQFLSKKDRQRTANGQIDSTLSTRIAAPEKEMIQVVEVKRAAKMVTIVRGMTSPMDTRKEILKDIKKALGVGGTLVEGVLEIQGAYGAKTVEALHKKGYVMAKHIGK